jgi:hypothetical protein
MIVYDHVWSYVIIYDHICYHVWRYMIVYDHVWAYVILYVIICGCVWSVRERPRTTLRPHISPGLHQTSPHLSRAPMRALKDPLNPTKAVHGAIMGSEKHDFPTLRETFRLCWKLRHLPWTGDVQGPPGDPTRTPNDYLGCTKDLPDVSGISQRP